RAARPGDPHSERADLAAPVAAGPTATLTTTHRGGESFHARRQHTDALVGARRGHRHGATAREPAHDRRLEPGLPGARPSGAWQDGPGLPLHETVPGQE